MVKHFLFFCCFFSLSANFIFAQDSKSFSLAVSLKLGYSHFLQNPNAFGQQSGIQSKIKGQPVYGLGIGVAKSWNDRIDWSAELQISQGRFQHRLEGLVTITDLLDSFNNPNESIYKANFQYWNLEVPLLAAINCSTTPNAYSIILGFGIAKNLSTKGNAKIVYGDGTETERMPPIYGTSSANSFAQLGMGKKVPFSGSNKSLLLRVLGKYYLFKEDLSPFNNNGNLFNINAEVALLF